MDGGRRRKRQGGMRRSTGTSGTRGGNEQTKDNLLDIAFQTLH